MDLTVLFLIIIVCFGSVLAQEGKSGDDIVKDIVECQEKLLGFIDNNLTDDIQKLLEKVSSNHLKDVHETLADRENLRFLILAHHNGFSGVMAALMSIQEELTTATEVIYHKGAIKRGELDISNLIHPFEYYGHKCGFARNVNL